MRAAAACGYLPSSADGALPPSGRFLAGGDEQGLQLVLRPTHRVRSCEFCDRFDLVLTPEYLALSVSQSDNLMCLPAEWNIICPSVEGGLHEQTAITIKRDTMRLIRPPQGRLGVQATDNECGKRPAPKRGRNRGATRIWARSYHQDRRGLARGRVVRPPAGNDGCEGLGQGPQTRPERNLQGRTGQGNQHHDGAALFSVLGEMKRSEMKRTCRRSVDGRPNRSAANKGEDRGRARLRPSDNT